MSERSTAPGSPSEPETDDAPAPPTPGFVRRHRRGLAITGSIIIVIAVFIGVTGMTGLSAPGALQRYRYEDLRTLAHETNATAGDLRTPDDCWRTLTDNTGPLREIAKVDYLRSRVVVRLYSHSGGTIDRGTRTVASREIDQIIAADPDLSWEMVEFEASPDGWSPTLSCRLATQGWVTGF